MSVDGAEKKGCPFCGGTNLWVTDRKSYEEVLGRKGKAAVSVQCKGCSCTLYSLQKETAETEYERRIEILWEKWNRRV